MSVELTETVFLSFISTFRVPNFEENKHKDMANSLGTRLARIDVLIGGAEQAQKQVDKMRDEWKKLRKEVENAQEQMNATTNTTLYDDNKKIYNEKVKQLERLTKLIREIL